MILQTPQIVAINAFDPSLPYDIQFIYDDNQIVGNTLVITDNDSGNIVYSQKQSGLKASHTIPGNTLSGGKIYTAKVMVFDSNNNSSNFSEQVLFRCFSAPAFSLSGIFQDELIHKSTLTTRLIYEQA